MENKRQDMLDKNIPDGNAGLILGFVEGKLPKKEMADFQKYIGDEKGFFEAMPHRELQEMLLEVVSDINIRLAYDDVEKLVISAQKKSGMTPYDRFSLVKEDPDKHEKTVFEKFIGYCGKYQPKFYEYRPKRRLNFKDFSIMHAPKKDADWHFERFCRKAGPSLDEQKAMRQVLDGICGKLPEAYGKIFVDRLKREVILLKLEAANEKAKAEMVSKTAKERIAFAKPKDPNGISSSALNGFQRPEKPAQPQPMKR